MFLKFLDSVATFCESECRAANGMKEQLELLMYSDSRAYPAKGKYKRPKGVGPFLIIPWVCIKLYIFLLLCVPCVNNI
jgi:hypothetical protein